MFNLLRQHQRTIFVAVVVIFIIGIFVGFGSYFFGQRNTDRVASVNGVPISNRRFQLVYERILDNLRQNPDIQIDDNLLKEKQREALQDLISEEVLWQEARKYNITVTDKELAAEIQRYPAFQTNGQFDRRRYFQILFQVLKMTPEEFEESRRRQIAGIKLRQLLAATIYVDPLDVQIAYQMKNPKERKKFAEEKDKLAEEVRQQKLAAVFAEWFKYLSASYKIRVYLTELNR